MCANGLAMPSCGILFGTMCSVWNAQSHSCVYGLNLQNKYQKHSLSGHILAQETSEPLKPRMRYSLC
jgi:hypothetical protein